MFEHKHPLTLIDLWSEQLQLLEEEYEENEEEKDDVLPAKQDFQCLCFRCEEDINWFHRYYYSCSQCDYSIHKFCAELPEILEDVCEVGHTLHFDKRIRTWWCDICRRDRGSQGLSYRCKECNFDVDVDCATKRLQKNTIHHPSHKHPLVCIAKQLLDKCEACGKEHKGIFYHCPSCARSSFIHSYCAFLPSKLLIQHTTKDMFFHIHHLTLAYSFPYVDQKSKHYPRCRVCLKYFDNSKLWIYKCEKCRYYTHLDCATSRNEPFMSILTSPGTGKTIKNYDDDQHLDLLHLPFRDPSDSILKHLFCKKDGLEVTISHQHSLILEDITTSSRLSFHDPMKRIELLCDGCLRPIISGPVYVCAIEDEHCNFVLHKWCSRLPTERKDHPHHPKHILILHSKIPGRFFGVFSCAICGFLCNGFVYYCEECKYCIDVHCAFLPEEITHNSHPNHLLSRDYGRWFICKICRSFINKFSFSCHTCDNFHLDLACALFIPETTMHKCDKHPMVLHYFPAENHKSQYFCEICEEELNPEYPFFHCHKCMQSIHPACAPSILRNETYTSGSRRDNAIYKFINVKFGGTYNNIKVHQHPLSFVQGVESDGR